MSRNLIVSIIGRPNVGKSSIFNTFIREGKKAITHDRPGITRDRHYSLVNLDEAAKTDAMDFILVDTGGFFPEGIDQKMVKEDHFFDIMTEHAKLAIEESDLVLFIVDVKEGLTPFDLSIANEIRKSKKEFWLLINKVDNPERSDICDFYTLGLNEDQMYCVSAAHARGLSNFKEKLHTKLNLMSQKVENNFLQLGVTPRDKVVSRVALIGAPNAGKSTLLNQFIGQKRALTSEIAGTTLDPIDGFFDLYFGENSKLLNNVEFTKDDRLLLKDYEAFSKNNENSYNIENVFDEENEENSEVIMNELAGDKPLDEKVIDLISDKDTDHNNDEVVDKLSDEHKGSFWRTVHLIDTAGIRKKSHIKEVVEEKSVFRSLRCITESDISLIMVDATIGLSHHDRRLIDIALEKGKSVIIALNKVDLLKKQLDGAEAQKEWIADIKAKHPWLEFCAIVPISAKYKKGIGALKNVLKSTIIVRHLKIPTSLLNKTVNDLIDRNPVTVKRAGGATLKVKYTSQLKSNPPTFLLFTNKSLGIPENYKRYLKNGIRSTFKLVNTPVHIIFRTSKELNKRAQKYRGEESSS